MNCQRNVLLASAIVAALCTTPAAGQNYPTRPIRLIAQSPAGGTTDLVARYLAQKLSDSLAQPVIVDNRAGAAGTVSLDITAHAAPDGYTLLLVGSPLAIGPTLRKGNLTYDQEKSFTYITLVGKQPLAFAVLPSFPATTLKDLIALAKARQGQITYGTAGTGSTNHITGEFFKSVAHIDMTHVPFKGGAPALAALLSSQIDLYIATTPTVTPMVKSGRVRVIVVSTLKRSPALPDVPTMSESGLPGFEVTAWLCIIGPAGINTAIVNRLHDEIVKQLESSQTRDRLAEAGLNVETSTPQQLRAFVQDETVKLGKIIKDAGVKVD